MERYHRSAEVKHPKCDRMIRKIMGVFEMRKYDKEFKKEAVKLSDEVCVKQASAQLGIPYYTLGSGVKSERSSGTMLSWAAGSAGMRRFPRRNGS